MTRPLTIFLATLATVVAVFMLLLVPVSLVVGHPLNAVAELALLVVCVYYVARVMREDRRRRQAAEALLPSDLRPRPRVPRRPITFQLRETVVAFVVWFAIVAVFNALVIEVGPIPNIGISTFAAFMLATLTVTGRHMMFRLTAEEDARER